MKNEPQGKSAPKWTNYPCARSGKIFQNPLKSIGEADNITQTEVIVIDDGSADVTTLELKLM